MNRGMNCEIQTPDVKLTQPTSDPAAGLSSCQKLDGGAMRPPGVWDGGVSGAAVAAVCRFAAGVSDPRVIKPVGFQS